MTIYESLIPIEKIEPERDLTKGDILSALRKGILGPAEARVMLLDLRYDAEETDLLIAGSMPPPEELVVEVARQLAKADIKSALKAELITPDEAWQRFIGLDYTTEDAQFLVDTYLMLEALKHVTKPRELTKADITKGVKTGLLSREEGYALLLELDYPDREAEYLLDLTVEAVGRSPASFQEFKGTTQSYRKAQGMKAKAPSPQLIEAEKAVLRLRAQIADMERRRIAEEDIAPIRGELGAAEYRYRQMIISQRQNEASS